MPKKVFEIGLQGRNTSLPLYVATVCRRSQWWAATLEIRGWYRRRVWIAFLWVANLCVCETRVKYARGVAEDPLNSLPMNMHRVCYNMGHLRMGVNATYLTEFLCDWAHRICDRVPRCVC